jgi:hypothetical protein
VGGILINSSGYAALSEKWEIMLDEFGLRPAFHMKDFGLHGRFATIDNQTKAAVFKRACSIIEEFKIYSTSAILHHKDYRAAFSEETRRFHSVYELCFIVAALGNGKMAEHNDYAGPIALVVDRGNPYSEQVRRAHLEMVEINKQHGVPRNLGSLTFADDDEISALQASDIICWGARRKATSSRFPAELSPIENLLRNEDTHVQAEIPMKALQELESYFQSIRKAGNKGITI